MADSDPDGDSAAVPAGHVPSRLLATVSHELRTPLTGILGLADMLLDTALTPEQENYARAVRVSAELMLGLVDDSLDTAKLDAGRFELAPRPTPLERLAEDVVELLSVRAHGRGLDVGAYVGPDMPAVVEADGPRLRQVLLNLVGNAVKFTEQGGVALTIERLAEDPARLAVAVADTGPGVAPEAVERIFAEFEGSSDGREGSGLGLAISRRIVRSMGGDITVAPRPGGGSVFGFSVPLVPAGAAPAQPRPDLSRRHVLIAAPASIAADLLRRHLADAGATVQMAAAATEAAALAGAAEASGKGYDAVLVDARLPGGSLDRIRAAAGRRIPAALLMQPGRRQTVAEIRAAGFDAYLVRPVRRSSLLRIAGPLIAGNGDFGVDPGDRRRPVASAEPAATRLRVLLADDDLINTLLIRSVLQRLGHEVTDAADGRAAVEAAKTAGRFDAAFIDLHLPLLDGLDVARTLREEERRGRRRRTHLVAMTADTRPDLRQAALEAGFDMLFDKPLAPEVIRAVLDTAAGAAAA